MTLSITLDAVESSILVHSLNVLLRDMELRGEISSCGWSAEEMESLRDKLRAVTTCNEKIMAADERIKALECTP